MSAGILPGTISAAFEVRAKTAKARSISPSVAWRDGNLARLNVRFGSKADIGLAPADVRFTPKSGHQAFMSTRPSTFCIWEVGGKLLTLNALFNDSLGKNFL